MAAYAAVIWFYFLLPLGQPFGQAMLGTAPFSHDAVLNAGILEWGRRALGSASLHLFEWTAGFPLHNTLANTENLLGWQPVFAILRWAGASVTFSYNTLFITSFFLSAVGVRLLARRFGASEEGAFLSGLIFAFVPFHVIHGIHLQTLAICWAPFAICCLDRYLGEGRWIDLAGVAFTFVLAFLSGLYIGLFLAIALPAYVGVAAATGRATVRLRQLLQLAAAGIIVAIALWPVISHYIAYGRANGYAHPTEVLTRFSIELLALVKVPQWQALWFGTGYPGITIHESAAFPGFVALTLFVAGLWIMREPVNRPTIWLLMVMALIFFSFSLGPRLLFQGETPVPYAKWIPLPGRIFERLSVVRWPMRALLLSLMFFSIVAGLGFTALTRNGTPRRRFADCALVALLLLLEYRPIPTYSAASVIVPDPLAASDAYLFLATETDRGAVVELPAADSKGYRTRFMVNSAYGSAGHLRRVAAIHGQALPPASRAIIEEAEKLPEPSAVMHLRDYGCSRVVLHRQWVADRRVENTIAALRGAGLPMLWESEESVIFSLTP